MCTHIWRLNPYMCLSLCVCVSLLKCTHIWRLNPYVSLAVFNKIRCVRYICKDAIETCRYILGTLSIDVSGNQDCTLWKSNIGAGGWLPIKHFHCPVEFLRCSKYWFGWVVNFCWVRWKSFWITYHAQIVVLQDLKLASRLNSWIQNQVFQTRFLTQECFFTINSNIDKKCFLLHTEIIFRSGTIFLLWYIILSPEQTNIVLSFPRWVFLIITGKLLLRTRNPKIHTNLPIRVYLISRRSEPLVPGIGLVQMNNWKPETGDPNS